MQSQALSHMNDFTLAIQSGDLELVVFVAPWSGPSVLMGHAIDALHTNYLRRVLTVDVAEDEIAAREWGIRVLPSLLLFSNGQLVESRVGAITTKQLKEWVENYAI